MAQKTFVVGLIVASVFSVFVFGQIALSQFDVYSSWDPYSGGSYGSGWTTLTPKTIDNYTGGTTSRTGGSTSGTSSGTSGTSGGTSTTAPVKIDWSTKKEPHNYGVNGFTIPDGAVGVYRGSGGGMFCLEDNGYWAGGPRATAGSSKITEKDKEVGEFTVLNRQVEGKKYTMDYGYIYIEKIVADDFIPSGCKPSWYKSSGTVSAKPVYVWDPNLDISESSTATTETIACTKNYERRIVIKNGTAYDAELDIDLYYQNTATTKNIAAYNSSTRRLAYPWTRAVIGRMDDATGTTGFICVQTQEYLDSLKASEAAAAEAAATNDATKAQEAASFNPIYGLPDFDLPLGAIVVQNVDQSVSCLESNAKISSVGPGEDAKLLYEGSEIVGQITLPNLDGSDYGFIFPELLSQGEAGVDESCYPSWYEKRPVTPKPAPAPTPPASLKRRYITRCELAELLMKASGEALPGDFSAEFNDVPADHAQAPYVYAGFQQGYWKSYKAGTNSFGCKKSIKRKDFAMILKKMLKLKKSSEARKFIGGGGKTFGPLKKLTRADALAAIEKAFP